MNKIISTAIMVGFPICIYIMSFVCSPEYFQPMWKHPLGIAMLVGSLVWLAIGGFLLLITDGWQRKLVFMLFPVPVTVMIMLGPAVLTIATAIGPVLGAMK